MNKMADTFALLKALNPRQRLFVQAYCINGFNALRAALDAGYAESHAGLYGHQLLKNPKIRRAIDAILSETLMSPEELKARVADDALATVEPFVEVTVHGGLQFNFGTKAARASLRWIKKLTITPTELGDKIAIELVDAQKAKDQLIRVFGLNDDKFEVTSDNLVVHAYFPDNGRGRGDGDG